MCEEWMKQVDDLEEKTNRGLEEKSSQQRTNPYRLSLCELQAATAAGTENRLADALQKAKAELLVILKYHIKESEPKHIEPRAQRGYCSSDEENNEDDNDNEEGR